MYSFEFLVSTDQFDTRPPFERPENISKAITKGNYQRTAFDFYPCGSEINGGGGIDEQRALNYKATQDRRTQIENHLAPLGNPDIVKRRRNLCCPLHLLYNLIDSAG